MITHTDITYREYMRRVAHNYRLARRVLAGNITALEAVGRALTWQTSLPGEVSSHVLETSFHDIAGSIFIGQLANLDKTGHDSVDWDPDGGVVGHELKTCDVDRRKIWRNQRGALQHGAARVGSQPSGLTSQISAAFRIGGGAHLNTKRRCTTLLLFDVHGPGNREAPFAAWQISGDWLVENRLRADRQQTQVVTVGTFIRHGHEISHNPRAPLVGWDSWIQQLKSDPGLPLHHMHRGRVVAAP